MHRHRPRHHHHHRIDGAGTRRRRHTRFGWQLPPPPLPEFSQAPRYAIAPVCHRGAPCGARDASYRALKPPYSHRKTLRQAQQIQSHSKSKQMHQNRLQCGCCNPGKCLGRCNEFVGLDSCNAPSGLNSDLICRNQYFLQALAQNNQIFQEITILN